MSKGSKKYKFDTKVICSNCRVISIYPLVGHLFWCDHKNEYIKKYIKKYE